MSPQELTLAAAAGAVCLAICATLFALANRRLAQVRLAAVAGRLETVQAQAQAGQAAAEAFDDALIAVEGGRPRLAAGEESLAACALVLGLATREGPAT